MGWVALSEPCEGASAGALPTGAPEPIAWSLVMATALVVGAERWAAERACRLARVA